MKSYEQTIYKILTGQQATESEEIEEAKGESEAEFQARQQRLAAAHKETQKNPDRLARMMRIPGYADAMKLAQKTTQKEEVEINEGKYNNNNNNNNNNSTTNNSNHNNNDNKNNRNHNNNNKRHNN